MEVTKKKSVVDLIGASTHKTVESLFQKVNSDREFEVMFFNFRKELKMTLKMFLQTLEYLSMRARMEGDKVKLSKQQTLDLSYRPSSENLTNFRLTIAGTEQVNHLMSMFHLRKNHVIYTAVLTKLMKKEPGVSIMKKVKNMQHLIDLEDLDIRFRLSDELKVSQLEISELQKISETARHRIDFRYKERVSLLVHDDAEFALSIDLTKAHKSNNINGIEEIPPSYELELEYVLKKGKPKADHLAKLYHETGLLLKVLQQSNYIISRPVKQRVLSHYQRMLALEDRMMQSLAGRKPHSLEIQHLVDILPNKYAVTDKADGERYFLFISDGEAYLIDNNMQMKEVGLKLTSKAKQFEGTMLDGELIYVRSAGRYLFMAFDCLFSGGEDVRQLSSFTARLEKVDEIIEKCFVGPKQKYHRVKPFSGSFDSKKIGDHYRTELAAHLDGLREDLKNGRDLLVRRKLFIPTLGGEKNEIFKYARLLWNEYTRNSKISCPYTLDGLVFHPLEQKYTPSIRESKFHEYKWKPANKNSIDFYITFERSRETGKVLTLYDNSRDDLVKGKPYRIAYLHVGKASRNGEQPVLFQREQNKYRAYLFLDQGEVRDLDGGVIQDKTVVEFYYNMDLDVEDKFRWVPMHTRYDKTEAVLRYKRRYGNYIDIANLVWRSITNPVKFDDFNMLSNDAGFPTYLEKMRGKIDHTLIMSERKENIYYQLKTNLAKPMRNYHNYIKSNLIYTYFNPIYNQGKKLRILDIACGRGGDIMKFSYSRVESYVGVDVDAAGLIAATDGALSRYNQLRKGKPNFPRMSFVHCDARSRLTYNEQMEALGSMTPTNKKMMEKFFDPRRPTVFDGLNCQFALHYFLESDDTWMNFCDNIKTHLRPGGFALFTCFDAHRVTQMLKGKKHHTVHYTNDKGEKKVLFDLVKRYDETDGVYGTGNGIDVHNGMISQEDVYNTEYLVDIRFLTEEFSKRCDLELVQSDYFETLYHLNEEFFDGLREYEKSEKTYQFLEKVGSYYNQKDSVNQACFQMSWLNRYYVFRRRGSRDRLGSEARPRQVVSKNSDHRSDHRSDRRDKPKNSDRRDKPKNHKKRRKQRGGDRYELTDEKLMAKGRFFHPAAGGDRSFFDGVVANLKRSEIIPTTLTPEEFCSDLGIELVDDFAVDRKSFSGLGQLVIEHEEEGETKPVINRMNLMVLNRTCDGYVIESHQHRGSQTMVMIRDADGYAPIYRETTDGSIEGVFDNRTARWLAKTLKESEEL